MAWKFKWGKQKENTLASELKDFEERALNIGIVDENNNPTTAIYGKYSTDYRSTGLSAFLAAINLISNSIAMLPINVKFARKVIDHPVHDAIYNGRMNKFNFMKQMIWELLMYGESLAYIKKQNGVPVELIYCEHGTWSCQYVQKSQQIDYTIGFMSNKKVKPNDVVHFLMTSENGYQGKSIRFYAEKVLKLAKATEQSAAQYYESGCAVKGALTIKGARKGAKEAARAAFQQVHAGDNGSGLVILDDDMDYKQLGADADKTQMLDSRMFNITEIARLFNINPVLLGDLSKSSYNTIEQAQLEFIQHTLLPYITMIECELTRKLISPSENGFTIDLDEKTLLRGDMVSTSNYIKNLVSGGIITINEGRDMLGLEHIDGADDLIIPFTNIDQNTIGNKNIDETVKDE